MQNKWTKLMLPGFIIALGVFLRLYKYEAWFAYGHDYDLLGWFVKDVVVNGHFRLIGQETSTPGIFIGPLFYYYQVLFYLVFSLNSIGGVFGVLLLSIFSVWSFYYVFRQMFSLRVGTVAMFFSAVSYYMVSNDREVFPTMPVILWSVWFLYTIFLLLKGKQTGYFVAGILIGLIWHMNMALIIVLPLLLLAILFSKQKVQWKNVFIGFVLATVLSLPLVLFEIRHGGVQTRAFLTSLTTNQGGVIEGTYRYEKVLISMGNNLKSMLLGPLIPVNYRLVLVLLFGVWVMVFIRKNLESKLLGLLFVWFILYLLFFANYSKVMSEYYINGSLIVFLTPLFVILGKFKNRWLFLVMTTFVSLNVVSFLTQKVEPKGYVEKRDLINFIKADAQEHNYSCVAISYITNPGYERGYRYLYWYQGLKVLTPISGAPVYSIVFPLAIVDRIDTRFGSLGLIFPDYSKYDPKDVEKSCSGEDSNLTDPMHGFVQ